jgi:dipeptidase
MVCSADRGLGLLVALALGLASASAVPVHARQSKTLDALDVAKDLQCFMVMAGKEATTDGSVLVAHNNDLTGAEASLVEKTFAADHDEHDVIQFPSGLGIPQAKHTYSMLVLRIHTGYSEGDAIAINEHQVSIGGGVALGMDQNEKAGKADPLVKKGLTGGIRYAALERCKTARECVEWIGKMYSRHGVTYPSGVAIADPNEIWYIEAGGGYSWAAVRIPDDAVWVQANAYRIGEIDFDDPGNFLSSPGLADFAEEQGLWDPADGPFHFARAFGRKRIPENEMFSNTRRVWRGLDLLNGDLDLDPDDHDLPPFIAPTEKLTVQKLVAVLRDHYQDTIYDPYREDAAGLREYAIATSRTVHTDVVQLRSWLPPDIGAVMWLGLSTAPTAMYVPFYFGIDDVPAPFSIGGAAYDPDSAFWAFRSLSNLVTPYFRHLIDDVRAVSREFENEEFTKQASIESRAEGLYGEDSLEVRQFLTEYTHGRAAKSLALAGMLKERLEVEIARHSFEW